MPFRQHAPSLMNARRVIYSNPSRLAYKDGVGFFNTLAFHGVFFGSPFAQSNHFRWFESLEDWNDFKEEDQEEEKYYVKKNCYGRSQTQRSLELLPKYWRQRKAWNDIFNKSRPPTVEELYAWLVSKENGHSKFHNIGPLTALLICGDLVEAGIVPMPSSHELGQLIFKVGKGAQQGMIMLGLVSEGANEEDFCTAFSSLDTYIQSELEVEGKERMGYNVVMLEHTLCKMKRLTTNQISLEEIFSEI